MRIAKQSILLFILFASFSVKSQENVTATLASIEENNPTIAALRAHFDYAKAEARAELLPPNPSVQGGRFPAVEGAGMKYAWGVSQQFEFPTVYAKRAKLAKTTSKYADASFNAVRQEVLVGVKLTLLEMVYYKGLLKKCNEREAYASSMVDAVQQMLDAGETSILEVNYAKLRVAQAVQNRKETEGRITELSQKLLALNGGKAVVVNDTILAISYLPEEDQLLETFRQNDPRFSALDQMVDVAQESKSLTIHQGLPELSIGYESEQTDAEHFMGFRAGITIPLWGNSGNRRAATAQLNAKRLEQVSQKLQVEADFEELYQRGVNILLRRDELRRAYDENNNIDLLRLALKAGEISTVDLFNEVTFLYGIDDKIMELELEYAQCYAKLYRFEL